MQKDTGSFTREDGFTISTEKAFLDTDIIYSFLSKESYWAEGISRELVEKSIENSTLCYGIYNGNPERDSHAKLVGFARVVSDLVRYAWLGDVFILPEYRGIGLSKWLIEIITHNPYLAGTSFNLGTKDAHGLYKKYGFKELDKPEDRLCRPVNWEKINHAYGLKN
ncbi:GNAT family N-acetyltransferase [Bacillus sp. T33-2]|uniref:GNAT family N-acetyltransferase n=1 Tax=Bacillus sp. T33-2 TaxID=2054168 RepID=UPI000C794716|nr:GNAT family N-acetyltransferase [Bacillus sp. T33-2]PLR89943.1 GNAT family N-acetyltransferase [Bacillus sp. T33-2]